MDQEAKHAALADLDSTIASLQQIRTAMRVKGESAVVDPPPPQARFLPPKATPDASEEEIDAQLSALLQPYNTTLEDLMRSGDSLPKNHIDAAVYLDSLALLETQIAETQQLADRAQADLDDRRRTLEKQLSLRKTGAALFGGLLNPHDIAQYTQAITAAEATLRHVEQTMAQHVRQLWRYAHTVRPIHAARFHARFATLVRAKLARAVEARKAEAEALLAQH